MIAILIVAAIVIICVVVWFVISTRAAEVRTPQQGKIDPGRPWPAPPPPGLCPTCGKDGARLAYLTVDCDEYVLKGGRCYQYEWDTICPREPRCHDEDHYIEHSKYRIRTGGVTHDR